MTGFLTFLGAGVLVVIGGSYALAKVIKRQSSGPRYHTGPDLDLDASEFHHGWGDRK